LSEDHKKLLESLIDGTYVEPLSYNPRPKRGHAKGNEESKDEEPTAAVINIEQQSRKRRKQVDKK